ncbi:MFS transporter [Cytobacillus solani]|uniref:MFS transporter n=1 Tax=Cytobacillus solani TaxID=1637975 RepID=A0A0Q3VHJ0_9BACI|nr:MFS transporter [Cytobacillus solani]KQL19691.1 MFS transporter [Cytobacillus solani]USK52919.1 MFS transporter [Cytobacillus solani]
MNRSFYALLVSQTSTNLGFALYTMVVVLHLYNESDSTALSAAVTLVSFIARMGSGLILPAVSDRYKPTHLLMFAQISQLLLLAGLFILFQIELTTTILVIVFMVLASISFFNGFFSPIKSTLVKSIVHESTRVKANSLISSVDQTFLFAGWTFGGVLLAFFGKDTTLAFTFGLLITSIVSLLLVKVQKSVTIQSQDGFLARITSGWQHLFQHKGLRILVIMDLMEAWVGTIWIGAVTLTFAKEALGKGEMWWGYINGGYYLGTIIGGLLVFRFSKWMQGRLTLFMLAGSFLFGLLTFFYGFVSTPYLALVLVLLMGPAYQLRDLAQETMFQNSIDDQTLIKILAARSTLVQLIFILSVIGIGVLTDLIGVRLVYILSGSLLLFSAIYGFYYLHIQGNGASLESNKVKAS